MSSWVYMFSRFTAEALLFESLAICGLAAAYAGFYVLRKRKLGAIQQDVPAGVVKDYLNELILDAQDLRAQMFGLLTQAGVRSTTGAPVVIQQVVAAPGAGAPVAAAAGNPADPAFAQQIGLLEGKMAEQAKAMEQLLGEKNRLTQELAAAKAGGAGGGGGAASAQLQARIDELEGKLAEYSVIEDDLANLKRLQQENAQLKAQLAALQGGAPAAAAAPAAAPAAPAADDTGAAAAAPVEAPAAVETPAPEAAAPAAAEAPVSEPGPAAFEGAVDQVEQNLQQPAAAAPAPEAPAAAPAAQPGKSDADLLSEFEKMLTS